MAYQEQEHDHRMQRHTYDVLSVSTAWMPTTCHRKCNKRTRSLWTFAVRAARPFLVPRADMSNWMKGLVGCQNCQKNGNTMWAGMTGTAGVILVMLEAEFFHFLDQGCTIHMQQVCRLALDPAGFHKGLHEELFFKRFDHGVSQCRRLGC